MDQLNIDFADLTHVRAIEVVNGWCFPVSGSMGEVLLYTTKMEQAMRVGMILAMKMKTAR